MPFLLKMLHIADNHRHWLPFKKTRPYGRVFIHLELFLISAFPISKELLNARIGQRVFTH
ncbi:hypothetical protein D3C86_1613200 [compost metagenome]